MIDKHKSIKPVGVRQVTKTWPVSTWEQCVESCLCGIAGRRAYLYVCVCVCSRAPKVPDHPFLLNHSTVDMSTLRSINASSTAHSNVLPPSLVRP